MKRFFGIVIVLLFLSNTIFSFSQNNEIELREKIKTAKDTTLINAYLSLAKYYYQTTGKGDSLIKFSNKALELSKRLNSVKHTLEAYKYSGVGYLVAKEFDRAEANFKSSLNLAIENNDLKNQADLFNKLGTLYQNSGQEILAIENLLKAAKYSEEISDYKNVAQSYYGISHIYARQKQLNKQLDYIEKALYVIENKNINDPLMENVIFGFASQQYMELYTKNNDQKYLSSIVKYAEKALKIAENNNFKSRKISSYNVLSTYYLAIEDYKNYEFYIKKVLENRHLVSEQITINAFFNLANIYKSRNQKTLVYAYIDTLNSLEIKSETYYGSRISNFSYEIYKHFNDSDLALKALEERDVFYEELNDKEKSKSINELEAKYQTQLKDAKIKRQTTQLIILALIIVFLLLIGAIVRLRYSRKQNKALKLAIDRQQKLEKELSDVRDEIAQDFHDDLGNRLARMSLLSNLINEEKSLRNPKIKSKIKQITDDANGLYTGTRDFIFSLKSNSDYLEEVITYLSDFGESFYNKTNVKFKLKKSIDGNIKLPHYWSKQLVFIFKEAMTNALKHAHCNKVCMSFTYHDKCLTVECIDDGIGISDIHKTSENGLHNMKKRAQKINCELLVDTSSEKGTTIKFKGFID